MAQIVLSENAPKEEAVYALAGAEFTLSPGDSYETDSREVISNAEIHPWLEVEYDTSEAAVSAFRPTVDPATDALAAQNSVAFDPEHVAHDREAVLGDFDGDGLLAVDPGLDQNEPAFVDEDEKIASTFAADNDEDEVID